MGAKEEKLPVRILFGFAGQSKPHQTMAGKCLQCGLDVWIDPPKTRFLGDLQGYSQTKYVHMGCQDANNPR